MKTILTFCLLLAGCTHKNASEPVWIGNVAPLSGPNQARGEAARNGILLAVEEVNRSPDRVAGRAVAVLHVDSRGDPSEFRPQAIRLIAVNKVVGLLLGNEAAEVDDPGAVAALYHVPMILPSGLPGRIVNEYVFYTGLMPALQGQLLARFANQQLKASPVLVLSAGIESRGPAATAMASALADAFVKQWQKSAHGAATGAVHVYHSTAEFKELLKQPANQPYRAVLLAGTADDLVELCKSGLDDKVPVLWGSNDGNLQAIQAARPSPVVYLARIFVPEGGGQRAGDFAHTYQERFGETPGEEAALAHDSARLLFEAMRQARSVEGPKVQKALAEMKNFDSLGGTLSIGKDHVASRPAFILRLKDGRPETLPFQPRESEP